MLNRALYPAILASLLVPIVATKLPAQRRGGSGQQNALQTSFVVHGSVVLPDHVAPRRIVRIEQICGGYSSGLAVADSKGHYSFDLGILYNPLTGAAGAGGRSVSSYAGCSIRASLEGFRAQPLAIGPLLKSQKTDAPPILLEPIAKDRSVIMSATDANAGAAARKDYDRGLDLVSQGKWREAIKAMEKVTAEEPEFATAWLSLGMLQVSQNQTAEALRSFSSAVAADEKFATPYIEMAVLETGAPQWDKVAEHAGKAIALDPDSFPRAYYLNTMANIRLRKTAEALRSGAEGIRVDQAHKFPDLQYMQGVLLMNTGDKARGRALLEAYLDIAPNGENAENARTQLKAAQ